MKKFLLALTIVLIYSAMAYAEDDLVLDTVIVTSQKTEEKAQDVPISMSVFGEVDLDDRLIDDVSEISRFTPGLHTVNAGSSAKSAASMRGFTSDYTSDASVGLYIDGVPVVDMGSFDETVLDVERIEVLRGPQGTLYGKNTEVGVVNVITKKPDNNLRGMVRVRAGEDDKKEVSFVTSGPIVKDKFFISVSGKHYEKDGFIENVNTGDTVNDRESAYGKLYLRWTPTRKLESSLILTRIKYNNGGPNVDYAKDKGYEVSNDLENSLEPEITAAAFKLSYELNDNVTLSSLTTSRYYKEKGLLDFDFTDNDMMRFHQKADRKYKTVSQEFKTNLKFNEFDLVSGLYLEKKDFDTDIEKDLYSTTRYTKDSQDYKSIGVFSHLTYNVTKKFSVIGGLRYDKDERESKNILTGDTAENDWSEISPKFALRYKPSEKFTTYATVAKGYRAGGFNTSAGVPPTYDQETLYSYEIGLKGTAFQDRVIYDAAVYYMDISDMQVSIYPDPTKGYKANAAEATSKGIETSATVRVTKNLKIFGGLSYNETTFDKYKDSLGDYNGNDTPRSPDYNFSTGFVYRTDKGYYASFDVTGNGTTYLDRENKYKKDPYQLLNGKVGYETEYFDIYAYGKNILDKEYDADGEFMGFYTTYSDPRELGIEIAYRF